MPFFECRGGMWKRLGSGSSYLCEISGAQPDFGVIIKTFDRLLDAKMGTKLVPEGQPTRSWFLATISVDFLMIFERKCTRFRPHFLSS